MGCYIYAWDDVNEKWVKVACNPNGTIIITTE